MKFQNPESGQALVGTLVIMVLVFAMAGSVALAASSLLDRQSFHRTAVDNDLRASDAITGAVAHVAGHGQDSGPVCDTSMTSFPNRLPGFDSTATCLRLDEVASSTLGVIALQWTSGCGSASVLGRSKVFLFFSALAWEGLKIWVDNSVRCDPGAYGSGKCTFSIPSLTSIGQRAIECDLGQVSNPHLHVLNSLSSPAAVRFVSKVSGNISGGGGGNGAQSGNENGGNQADTTGPTGSIYELAASTGLPAGPQFEEGSVFVSRSGSTTVLLSEAAL